MEESKINVKAKIDTTQIDEAIEKVSQLKELLKEVKQLINSL